MKPSPENSPFKSCRGHQLILGKKLPGTAAPVSQPVAGGADAVAAALIQAGQALLAAAAAISGKTVATPSISLSAACQSDLTIAQAVNDFLTAKLRAGKSDRYVRTMLNSLSKFARGRGSRPLGSVTFAEIEKWLAASDWNATTRRGYLRDVRTLYFFAVRRNWTASNPAAAVELPERAAGAVGIHTPKQVAIVLNLARDHDPTLCRALAVRYFAGLRSSECDRMTEADILERSIQVRAENAKTRRRRLVLIAPVLRSWLALGGELPLRDVNDRMRKFTAAVKAQGVPWPHNVTRHSFVSYHLAHGESAAKTALQAGHSEAMLFQHYREIVTPEAAAEFWALTPDKCRNIVETL